jgi:menaquinone-dependent protoporphyrinogen oxidase
MAVLVRYASEHGSTRGIAERIAARLREQGHEVDAGPLDRAGKPDGYGAVVIGGAIHDGAWLEEAAACVRGNLDALTRRPVWLFSVGLAPAVSGWFERHAKEPKDISGFRQAIRPRDHHLFAGALRREHLPRTGRLICKAMRGRSGDFRDWAEIDAWADAIGRSLPVGAGGT